IKPYGDDFSKKQMRIWKESESVRKVHEDLYMQAYTKKCHLDLISIGGYIQRELPFDEN
ncbi:14791_t:CDS:2, partial [Funneliformis caledonium]